MYLDLKTEYSFGAVYGPLDKLALFCSTYAPWAGIADKNGSWGHIKWFKACKQANIKPIYGVSLTVVENDQMKVRRCARAEVVLIAMNNKGLVKIYQLIDQAHQQFYYWPRISFSQINSLSNDVALIVGPGIREELLKRHAYKRIRPNDPLIWQTKSKLDPIASIDNYYIVPEDFEVYEPFADQRKKENKTGPQFILDHNQWSSLFPKYKKALTNMKKVAKAANVTLIKAPMIKYEKTKTLKSFCIIGAKKRSINLKDPVYKERLERELKLIEEKKYKDYFLIVADLVKYARSKMIVGPSRGSCAGSLVCYLLGITEVDPIPYGLFFERFIDVNRLDLPDIDIDFQDNKRDLVIKYLKKKYGQVNVAQIGNISHLKPKSALIRFAKSLLIPLDEIEQIKEVIPNRPEGDKRALKAIEDTFTSTKIGKEFLENYPNMKVVKEIEGHVSHTSIHAAGILITNKPIYNYAGINSRDPKINVAMVDKKMAEEVNLLKIDALGLRTLTIFAETLDAIGKPYKKLYKIPLDDPATYEVFFQERYAGIFQFEGFATANLAKQMTIENLEDISALSALSRPGPLISGSSQEYVKRRVLEGDFRYLTNHPAYVEATKETYGVIVYQEQVLKILKDYGNLSWEDTSKLRKAIGKSLGEEVFKKYKKKFIKGSTDTKEKATEVWEHIITHGAYSFNKAHSIAYGWISYLCAWFKAHHLLEFAVACLNNSKDDRSTLKLLRDLKEIEGIEHVPFDINKCQERWTVQNGKLYAGLTTLHGIGPANAKKIIKLREKGKPLPPGIQKHIDNLNSPFLYLYPGKELYSDYYSNPKKHNLKRKVSYIKEVNKNGRYIILGCLIEKKLLDLNDAYYVTKRDGKYLKRNTSFLKFKLEDDTDNIFCMIDRYLYPRLGKPIAEKGEEDKDWYLVYGEIKKGYKTLNVLNVKRITR